MLYLSLLLLLVSELFRKKSTQNLVSQLYITMLQTVIVALLACRERGIATGGVLCNNESQMRAVCDVCVEVETGPEFVTGSTRMKAGTATKMVLNMITTSVMIRLGHVKDNKMIDMQLTNHKLIARGTTMVMDETGLPEAEAKSRLLSAGSVRKAVDQWRFEQQG